MTKEEAFNILANVTGQLNATREVHDKIREALVVMKPKAESCQTKSADSAPSKKS